MAKWSLTCPLASRSHAGEGCSGRVEPAEPDRIPLPVEQGCRLVERQADDVGIGADQLDHEGAGEPLDGIAARLATPLARGEIAFELVPGEALEADAGFHQALADGVLRRDETDGGVDPVGTARKQSQA